MRTIGLLGGLSWHSTLHYYRRLNELVSEQKDDHSSCPVLLFSFDFQKIVELQRQKNWTQLGKLVFDGASALIGIGAEAIAICSNTMHKSLDFLPAKLPVPVIHMGAELGSHCHSQNHKNIGFLGTGLAMSDHKYLDSIVEGFDQKIVLPQKNSKQKVDKIIFEELVKGRIVDSSRAIFESVIQELKEQGADSVILGCTEISLLIQEKCQDLPLIDSLEVHTKAIAKWALGRT
jgi:aspartate racemase